MEPTIDNLEISDIIFANYSSVYAQVVWGEETGLYHVYTAEYLYKIAIMSGRFRISRWASLNHFPNKAFFKRLDIKYFTELEAFILSKLLLE
jgi:hypothetical protein